MDPQDVDQLLSVINHVRDRAMILLLLRIGMRIGEFIGTKTHDVDLNNHRILIYEAEKTGLDLVVYYSGDAQEALLSWLKEHNSFKEMLFYTKGRQSICYETCRSMFSKYLHKAELGDRGYALHCLRHIPSSANFVTNCAYNSFFVYRDHYHTIRLKGETGKRYIGITMVAFCST